MKQTVNKMKRIIDKDYSRSRLKKYQDWHITIDDGSGYGEFMTLEETKDHLLEKMIYTKKAIEEMRCLYTIIEDSIKEVEITGNLFADTLNISECLSLVDLFAETYHKAFTKYELQEEKTVKKYFHGINMEIDDEEEWDCPDDIPAYIPNDDVLPF